jgi:nitroreductase
VSNEDLLRPTLSDHQPVPELYNTTGFFMSSFFGGPLGATIYGGANSLRLGRLAQDLPLLVALAAAAFLLPLMLHEAGWLQSLAASIGGRVARNYQLFMRTFGLATCGAIYFMHRRFFRSARVSGAREKAGWIPGFVAFGAGMAANAVFVSWLLKHR